MDRISPAQRSANMSRVKQKDTRPELEVRRALHAAGLRYRLHAKKLPGKPDLVFASARLVLFVHGCFWHQHACAKARLPSTRADFWHQKLEGNVVRDRRNAEALEKLGWKVEIIWECEIDDRALMARLIDSIRKAKSRPPCSTRTTSRRRS
jgi:DNA mismatch endonuclease, patch repair protein